MLAKVKNWTTSSAFTKKLKQRFLMVNQVFATQIFTLLSIYDLPAIEK